MPTSAARGCAGARAGVSPTIARAITALLAVLGSVDAFAPSCAVKPPPGCQPLTQLQLPTNGTYATSFWTYGAPAGSFYTNNLDCIWNMTVPAPMRLVLWFTVLDVEAEPACLFDALRIFDRSHPFTSPAPDSVFQSADVDMVAVLCGNYNNSLPDPYVLGSSALMQLTTDTAGTARGFIATVAGVTPASCVAVGLVTHPSAPFGVFEATPTSVLLPTAMVPAYQQGLACSWSVSWSRPGGVQVR